MTYTPTKLDQLIDFYAAYLQAAMEVLVELDTIVTAADTQPILRAILVDVAREASVLPQEPPE